MRIIGLTGGIASGKSTVAQFLEELGALVIDADRIGHEILRVDAEAREAVLTAFGSGVFTTEGEISREKLGDLVFSAPDHLSELNWIMHPRIKERVETRLEQHRRAGVRAVVLEAALLLEAELDSLVDEVWVTVASEETIIRRLKERTGLSQDASLARIRAQLPSAERLKGAHVVIDTDCSLDELKARVASLWREFLAGLD